MAVDYPLTEGFDPSSVTEATGAQLLQMVRQARPKEGFGVVIIGAAQPDTANNPWMVRCLWLDTSDSDDITLRQYNSSGGAWEPIGLGDGSVTNDKIADQTIKATEKLDPADGAALKVIRVDSAGNAIEWVNPGDLFGTGSFNVSKLAAGSEGYFISVVGGNASWVELSTSLIVDKLGSGGLPVSALTPGTGLYVLRSNAAGTATEWVSSQSIVTLAEIQAALAFYKLNFAFLELPGANKVPVGNAGNTDWTFIDKDSLVSNPQFETLLTQNIALDALRTAGIKHFAHTAGKIPEVVQVYLKCTSADAASNWNPGDCINIESVLASNGSGTYQHGVPLITVVRSAGNISLYLNRDADNFSDTYLPHNNPSVSSFVNPTDEANFDVVVDVLWLA